MKDIIASFYRRYLNNNTRNENNCSNLCNRNNSMTLVTLRISHLLEPNTYECPIRTIRTYWAEIPIFDQKMSCSAQYVRMAMTLKILQVLIILPLKIYKFTTDNSTHGNFVQRHLDQRQFRPNSIVSVSTSIS